MKSLDHSYAQVALESVKRVEKTEYGKQYGALCHRFPAMVYVNGLRLTVAFYQAQAKKEAYQQFIQDLGTAIGVADWSNLANCMAYRQHSRNALRAAIWFKRYAEAILKVHAGQEVEQEETG